MRQALYICELPDLGHPKLLLPDRQVYIIGDRSLCIGGDNFLPSDCLKAYKMKTRYGEKI
jgi:hypothetical protein